MKSASPPQSFCGSVGVTGVVHHGGVRGGKRGDVGNGIKIGSAVGVTHPEPFLPCGFETGVVAFALGTESVDALEREALAVNGKAIVIGYGFVLGAAAVLLSVVPISVVARALPGLGLAERTAEFLA